MFIPLHTKSDYSLGYGTASVDELVDRAAELGYPALGLTDLENLYGQVRFHARCRTRGIHAITGVELRPGFDDRRNFGNKTGRLVLLASNREGYSSLCRIVSRRSGSGGRRGRGAAGGDLIPPVSENAAGLIALSEDPVTIERLAAEGAFSKDNLGLLLVRPGDSRSEILLFEQARRLGIRVVADLDAVFPLKSDYPLHQLQVAVHQGRLISEVKEKGFNAGPERYLRSPSEAAALFADVPGTLEASAEIAERCRFSFRDLEPGLPELVLPGGAKPVERLRGLCAEKLVQITGAGKWTIPHEERLEFELAEIERLGLSAFMVIVGEILDHCRQKKIPAVVRGSAVSSLVIRLLGGSAVDPVESGLLFERFLHEAKSEWPDVDIDLPWQIRDDVIEWVHNHFGRERTVMVAAHHTLQRRSALRAGLKAFGIRSSLIDKLSATLPPDDLGVEEFDFLGLSDAIPDKVDAAAEPIGFGHILPLVQRLVGRPHHPAVHPGGVVIGRQPMEDILPLERAPKGVLVTQYDMAALAEQKMVKIDLLGNRFLSEFQETLRLAGSADPAALDAIPANDSRTLELIDNARTIGCFQLETPAMRSLLARLPIRSEDDLTAALALIRPGAAAGQAKAAFIRRARGEEPAEILDSAISDRLRQTQGMLLYEEDIMVLLARTGELTVGEADELRSAIVRSGGDPQRLSELESGFLARCGVNRGESPATLSRARRTWAEAARFASYSFNKAHAASYSKLAYLSAYLKTHHPVEFSCALINHHQGMYPLRTLASDLTRQGVILLPPHVNFSEYHSAIVEGAVRVGLDKIKGLTVRTAGKILEEREKKGPFTTFRDLADRIKPRHNELSALVLSGACDDMPPLLSEWYPFVHETALDILKKGGNPAAVETLRLDAPPSTPQADIGLYSALVRVRHELRYLEMHLSAHPVGLLRPEAERYGCISIRTATARSTGSRIRLLVIMAAMRRVLTRNGIMQFLTLEDETGLLEAVVLPSFYRALGDRVTTPGPFLMEGTLRRQQDAAHLDVFKLSPFNQRRRPFGKDEA